MSEIAIKENHTTHPALAKVRLTGSDFYGTFTGNIATRAARDILKKFKADGALENYARVTRGEQGTHDGYPWFHGLICECIRGLSDMLVHTYDAEIDAELDAMIKLIASAADADPEGYLNPYTTLMCPDKRYGRNAGDAVNQHETYNAGCLCEAGVHHYLATGKTTLLAVAVRMWNGLADFIGMAPKHEVGAEHSLPEEALVKLSDLMEAEPEICRAVNGRPAEYRRLASYFINRKGCHEGRYSFPPRFGEYCQDHRPPREQRFAVGHAVRGVLLYTGMAAVAAQDKDEELGRAALAIWRDITQTKLHVSGCVGVSKNEEKFGQNYQLPNDAYLETCAGVGLAFFGYRLSEICRDSSIYDTVEVTLQNLMPVSISETFDHYTYQNPICSTGDFERWEWHKCPCCPPMLLKLVGMLPQFIYARKGNDLYVNLYADSEWREDAFTLTRSDKGFRFTETAGDGVDFRLFLRIPGYAKGFAVRVNGKATPYEVTDGYAVVNVTENDTVTVDFDAPVVRYAAHPYVKADRDMVMIKKGAVLYCLEAIDQPYAFDEEGKCVSVLDANTPLTECENGNILGRDTEGRTLTFIPYRSWNNRGKCAMTVWLRDSRHRSDFAQTDIFGHNLYLPADALL